MFYKIYSFFVLRIPIFYIRLFFQSFFCSYFRLSFYDSIARLTADKTPLSETLSLLSNEFSDDGKRPESLLSLLSEDCLHVIRNGGSFADGLRRWIPANEFMIIAAGVDGANLADSLNDLIRIMKGIKQARTAMFLGTAYPVFLFFVLLAMLGAFYSKMLPTLISILPFSEWKGRARSLANISDLVYHYWFFIIIAFFAITAFYSYILPRWTSKWRVEFDGYFPFSLYKTWQGLSFLLAISALSRSKVSIKDSLAKLSDGASPYLKQRIDLTRLYVIDGLDLGQALKKTGYNFPDKNTIRKLSIFSSRSGFDQAIFSVANDWMERAVDKINAQMKVVFYLSMLVVAIFFGWMNAAYYEVEGQAAEHQRVMTGGFSYYQDPHSQKTFV